MKSGILCALLVSSALVFAACGKKQDTTAVPAPAPAPSAEPAPVPAGVAVSSVTTGSAIGADKRVLAASETFAPKDTMYVSIDTTGTGTAVLLTRWTFHKGGNVAPVHEDSITVDTIGPATHEFHVSKPDGWPAGDYQVEVLVDGKSAGTKKLTVR